MGRQERLLTIDGEYIHLDGAESKGFFDRGKSAVSHHLFALTLLRFHII